MLPPSTQKSRQPFEILSVRYWDLSRSPSHLDMLQSTLCIRKFLRASGWIWVLSELTMKMGGILNYAQHTRKLILLQDLGSRLKFHEKSAGAFKNLIWLIFLSGYFKFWSKLHMMKNVKKLIFSKTIRTDVFEFPEHLWLFRNWNLISKDDFRPWKDNIFEIFKNRDFEPKPF